MTPILLGDLDFLTSITNTTIADKITGSEFLPQNLQQCFKKALRLEASLQLSKGVNMAHKTTVMNVEIDADDEINLIKDARADQMPVVNVEKWNISKEIVRMMEISPQMVSKNKRDRHLVILMILL